MTAKFGETHHTVTGTYVDNDSIFVGVKFTIGIPEIENHDNPSTAYSPLNILSLQWYWQLGYKFMRFDVSPIGGVSRPSDLIYTGTTWNFHLGSTGCSEVPELGETVNCDRENRPEITLDNFNLGVSKIIIDYGVLVETSSPDMDGGGAGGCQSGITDPECAQVFSQLGLDIETGDISDVNARTIFSIR